jgi:serine/threonine protein kinase
VISGTIVPMDDESGDSVTRTIEAPTLRKELSSPKNVQLSSVPPSTLPFGQRYMARSTLGEGGMGVVRLYDDLQVGRAIAMKEMRGEYRSHPEAVGRFLREARIQGQLEHPAVVPVYDIGVNADDSVFFTMKRVLGTTLHDVIWLLRDDPDRYSKRRLLTAFGSVCLAVDLAHRRGVLHRDLKPANIMLGDFGEVYVLDWGLARVSGSDTKDTVEPVRITDLGIQETQAGAVLGTPGYMSPEQIHGKHAELGPASDIYSLGAILFEILALEPLHTGKDATALCASTLAGVDARLSWRAPNAEIAPELEAIVLRATKLEPKERYQSAREIYEAIEAHLDGERDLELRRQMSAEHAERAARAAEKAADGTETGLYVERREALRQIGRALALDPDNSRAMETLVRLLSDPPRILPQEVRDDVDRAERVKLRRIGWLGAIAYLHQVIYLPVMWWLGVRRWDWLLTFLIAGLGAGAVSLFVAKQKYPNPKLAYLVLLLSHVGFAALAAMWGPLFFMPMILVVNATGFALYMGKEARPLVAACSATVLLGMLVLSLSGMVPGGYAFTDQGMLILPGALSFPATATVTFLALVNLSALLVGVFIVGNIRDQLDRSERQLMLYAWQLREFVPSTARSATDPTSKRRAR